MFIYLQNQLRVCVCVCVCVCNIFPQVVPLGAVDKIPFRFVCSHFSLLGIFMSPLLCQTDQLTPWTSVLDKLTVVHLLKKFPVLHKYED